MKKHGVIYSGSFALHYAIEGTGVPILIIGSAIYYPRTFSDNFKKNHQCVFIDHRGFAPSPGQVDNTNFDLEVLIDDIELVRKKVGLDQFFILGHSGHGYLAMEYAKKYQQYVKGVILVAVGPDQSDASAQEAHEHFEQTASLERKEDFAEQMSKLGSDISIDPENRMIHYLLRARARGWYDFNIDATPLWKDVMVNMQMFDHVWGSIFKTIDITKGLGALQVPVLLILGMHDYIIAPPSTWKKYIPYFKDLTVELFEKSGHTPQLEETEKFDQVVDIWIKKHVSP